MKGLLCRRAGRRCPDRRRWPAAGFPSTAN